MEAIPVRLRALVIPVGLVGGAALTYNSFLRQQKKAASDGHGDLGSSFNLQERVIDPILRHFKASPTTDETEVPPETTILTTEPPPVTRTTDTRENV